MSNFTELMTIKEASRWASEYLQRDVTTSNISYLIQYGRVKKIGNNSDTRIIKRDLLKYYNSYIGRKEQKWKHKLGNDLNWALSFDQFKEKDTTKHVHRLHPYKGKFIPQLVEYFLDEHTDSFKKEICFYKNDIILDPFCGSGTSLVQANELGINAIGIDISAFNTQITNIKIGKYDFIDLKNEIRKITHLFAEFIHNSNSVKFEQNLLNELAKFNNKHFPTPEFKYRVRSKEIDEWKFGREKENEFLKIFKKLVEKYNLTIKQERNNSFLEKWYLLPVRNEIDFVLNHIKEIKNTDTKKVLQIILSRSVRSCRATTHFDLATLKEPVYSTYYCHKHFKICKPLFSMFGWWQRYANDTLKRLAQFQQLRTDTYQKCFTGDSRNIDLFKEIKNDNPEFYQTLIKKKINGIFSSPPYVGLIDYHEQHAYAYELFGYERKDELEIGPLFNGNSREARESYIKSISVVLNNYKKFLIENYDVFLVANDKFNMYPKIAEKSGMKIVNRFKRPVLNRTERDKTAYAEIIFHLREI